MCYIEIQAVWLEAPLYLTYAIITMITMFCTALPVWNTAFVSCLEVYTAIIMPYTIWGEPLLHTSQHRNISVHPDKHVSGLLHTNYCSTNLWRSNAQYSTANMTMMLCLVATLATDRDGNLT